MMAGIVVDDRLRSDHDANVLGFFWNDDRTAVIVAAIWTCSMQEFWLAAIRAFAQRRHCRFVMSAAFLTSSFGVAAFRIWHCSVSFLIKLIFFR